MQSPGRSYTPMKAVIEAGADMATIGTAITRPHLITERKKAAETFEYGIYHVAHLYNTMDGFFIYVC